MKKGYEGLMVSAIMLVVAFAVIVIVRLLL